MCNSKMDAIKWQQPLQLVGFRARVLLFCQRSCERKQRSCERKFTRGFARKRIWWLCHSPAHESRQLRRLKWQMKFLSCCFCLESVPSFSFELNLCCIMYIIQEKNGIQNCYFFSNRHSYSVAQENHLVLELHHHKKACRALSFSLDGLCKLSPLL